MSVLLEAHCDPFFPTKFGLGILLCLLISRESILSSGLSNGSYIYMLVCVFVFFYLGQSYDHQFIMHILYAFLEFYGLSSETILFKVVIVCTLLSRFSFQ